jgi:ABC-type cobalamin/Fe3+-siderophores transport system ATPase subunit
MSLFRVGLSLVGLIGVLAATLAAATIWLLLTEPLTVADAINEQELAPLVRELADILYAALRSLLRFL